MRFFKYHGLGNDYIVLSPADFSRFSGRDDIVIFCDRHFGAGSDGLLVGPTASDEPFGLSIFNPDGSEAEKSGNGLRIFARYLWDMGMVGKKPFDIRTKGGLVRAQVREGGNSVIVEMGQARFISSGESVSDTDVVGGEVLTALDKAFCYWAVSMGNPHCVILVKKTRPADARRYGPVIENSERFLDRTNVQFVEVLDSKNIRLEIWERGAGYTLASGSSSCAAAAAVYRAGLCEADMQVHMPGGTLRISIDDSYNITMEGAVIKVYEGCLADEFWS